MNLQQHRRFKARLLKRIALHSEPQSHNPISVGLLAREKERYLTTKSVQIATLYDLWMDYLKFDKVIERARMMEQPDIPVLDYRRIGSHKISFFHQPRSTEGFRKICRLPFRIKMWHSLARDLIVAQHKPRDHIGDWKGRGRDWQVKRLLSALTSSTQGVVIADIKTAFASVNMDAVYHLLPYLPEQLIRRAIDYRSHRFERRERSEYAGLVSSHFAYSAGHPQKPLALRPFL